VNLNVHLQAIGNSLQVTVICMVILWLTAQLAGLQWRTGRAGGTFGRTGGTVYVAGLMVHLAGLVAQSVK
jgi:hypothetical protein